MWSSVSVKVLPKFRMILLLNFDFVDLLRVQYDQKKCLSYEQFAS